MHSFELEVNERLEIMVGDKAYKSLIIDIEDDWIKINLPVCDGEYLMLYTGDLIDTNVYLENEKCFNFQAKILSKGKEGNIPYYKLSKPFDIKKIQRRNFFRVGILNHAYYKNITNINENEFDNMPYIETIMIDLSAGGVKFKLKEVVQIHDLLSIKMTVKGMEMSLKGEVVRVEITEDRERLCGIKFLDITQTQVDKVIEELFTIMRKQRALT